MEKKPEIRTFTKEEIINETIKLLENLSIPVKYIRQMGGAIAGAVENLHVLQECMKAEANAVQLKVQDEQGNELPADDQPIEVVEEVTENEAEYLPEAGE